MSRKDYVLLASVLRSIREDIHNGNIQGDCDPTTLHIITVNRMADALRMDNGRFDRERFTAASVPQT